MKDKFSKKEILEHIESAVETNKIDLGVFESNIAIAKMMFNNIAVKKHPKKR